MDGTKMNGTVLLRKLAWKSILSFGQYEGCSLRQAYDNERDNGKAYLAWMYYHLTNISFIDEIIDELGLIRIDKPGKKPEVFREYTRTLRSEDELQRIKDYNHGMKMIRQRASFKKRAEHLSTGLSKGMRAALNQGKGVNRSNY